MEAPLSDSGYRQELERRLGLGHLIVFGLIFMVPIAPMAVYGFVAKQSYGMVPLVYLVGMTAMFFTVMSYRQLSREFPIAGSVYSYVQRGLHPYAGFVAGWLIVADYLLVPSLIYAFAASWLHGLLPGVPLWVWIAAFIGANSAINVLGIELQARANFVLLAVQLVALALFLVSAVQFVFIARHGTGGWSIAPFYQPAHINGHFIATATSIAVLSFLGFDAVSTLAEEAHDPRRNIGNAMVLALLLLGALFAAQTYVAALAHPDYETLDAELGFFQIGQQVGGHWLYVLLLLANVAGAVISALAAQTAIARMLYAMGRDRALPGGRFFAYIQPRFKTPVNAIALVAILSFVLAVWVPVETILKLVNFGALTAFMLLNLTVFVFFYIKRRNLKSIFRYLLLPLLGLAIVAFVWSGFDRATFAFGGVWLAIGLLLGISRYKNFASFESL